MRTVLTESPLTTRVRGYMKPESAFFTLEEWEDMAWRLIALQEEGIDTRGGRLQTDDPRLLEILNTYFWYQLNNEVERWELLTTKTVLDFIEDFINHRLWGLQGEFGRHFPDIRKLRIAYFYSRGDLEPYVLLDDEYTKQIYGSLDNVKELYHFTSEAGLQRLQDMIDHGPAFDISTYTIAERAFFRRESNLIVTLLGNVRAGFRSDIKSLAIDSGKRACNMHRLEYPGYDQSNVCYDLRECDLDGDVRTGLWNEYIATPVKIISVTRVE